MTVREIHLEAGYGRGARFCRSTIGGCKPNWRTTAAICRATAFLAVFLGTYGFILSLETAGANEPCEVPAIDSDLDAPHLQAIRDDCDWTTARLAGPDINTSFISNAFHRIDRLRDLFSPQLLGEGISIGVWDDHLVMPSHAELDGRVFFGDVLDGTPDSQILIGAHATHVAGTIAADGGLDGTGRFDAEGVAKSVTVVSYDWNHDVEELSAQAEGGNNRVTVSNHSYSNILGWKRARSRHCSEEWSWYGNPDYQESHLFGKYQTVSRGYDSVVFKDPALTVVVAAGNERASQNRPNAFQDGSTFSGIYCIVHRSMITDSTDYRPGDGAVDGGFDTLGARAVAKNVITVGAMKIPPASARRLDFETTEFSSWGPPDDGRIKPDIVALGQEELSAAPPVGCWYQTCSLAELPRDTATYSQKSGTSMAAPVVTGVAALLNQLSTTIPRNESDNAGRQLFADEVKALLIHTALSQDPNHGPNYRTGWGVLNAPSAGDLLLGKTGKLIRIPLAPNTVTRIPTVWTETDPSARVTLVWVDPPPDDGMPSSDSLDDRSPVLVHDLDLIVTSPNGTKHFPWRLDPTTPEKLACNDRKNNRDNVERIDIATNREGQSGWEIAISTPSLSTERQWAVLAVTGFDVNPGFAEATPGTGPPSSSDPVQENGTDGCRL